MKSYVKQKASLTKKMSISCDCNMKKLLALPDSDLADAAAEVTRTRSELSLYGGRCGI